MGEPEASAFLSKPLMGILGVITSHQCFEVPADPLGCSREDTLQAARGRVLATGRIPGEGNVRPGGTGSPCHVPTGREGAWICSPSSAGGK